MYVGGDPASKVALGRKRSRPSLRARAPSCLSDSDDDVCLPRKQAAPSVRTRTRTGTRDPAPSCLSGSDDDVCSSDADDEVLSEPIARPSRARPKRRRLLDYASHIAFLRQSVPAFIATGKFLSWWRNSCHFDVFLFGLLAVLCYAPSPLMADVGPSVLELSLLRLLATSIDVNVSQRTKDSDRDVLMSQVMQSVIGDYDDPLSHIRSLGGRGSSLIPRFSRVVNRLWSTPCKCAGANFSVVREEGPVLHVSAGWSSSSGYHPHHSVSEAVFSALFRPVHHVTCISSCVGGGECPGSFVATVNSLSVGALLVVALPPSHRLRICPILVLPQHRYSLVSISWYGASHYLATSLFGSVWYCYDDSPSGPAGGSVTIISSPHGVPVQPRRSYKPRLLFYRRVRCPTPGSSLPVAPIPVLPECVQRRAVLRSNRRRS